MYEYIYNKTDVIASRMQCEIETNGDIETLLVYVLWNLPDDLRIMFEEEIPEEEVTVLNAIVAAHPDSSSECTETDEETTGSGSVSGIDHYELRNLDNDDHLQYILVDGTRGFTGTVSGVYPTEDYHLTTKEYVGDTLNILGVGDLPCIQIRRTVSYLFSTTWEDITFNTTDIESNTDVLQHDDSLTDRILVKEDGFYKITYTMPIHPVSSAIFQGRMRVNDSTVIPGSWMWVNDANDTDEMSNDFIAELSAGDFITLQLDADCKMMKLLNQK